MGHTIQSPLRFAIVGLGSLQGCAALPHNYSVSANTAAAGAQLPANIVPVYVAPRTISVIGREILVTLDYAGPDMAVKLAAFSISSSIGLGQAEFVELRDAEGKPIALGGDPVTKLICIFGDRTFKTGVPEPLPVGEYELRLKPGADYQSLLTEVPKPPGGLRIVAEVDTSWHRFRIAPKKDEWVKAEMLD